MSSIVRISLFLGLVACGSQAESNGPTDPPQVTTAPDGTVVPELPRGVDTVPAEELVVRLDGAIVTCDGDVATIHVDTMGYADALTVDFVDSDVTTVVLTMNEGEPGAIWRSFHGEAPCTATIASGSMVLRAERDGKAVDCAVAGPDTEQLMAGAMIELLTEAGRPDLSGCHRLADH
jgi:hypothetical protein